MSPPEDEVGPRSSDGAVGTSTGIVFRTVTIAALVFALGGGVDLVVGRFEGGVASGFRAVLATASLGALVGAVFGGTLGLARRGLARAPRVVRAFVFAAVGAGPSLALASDMAVVARLGTALDAVSLALAVACLGFGGIVAFVLFATTPTARAPLGWATATRSREFATLGVAAAALVGALYVDRLYLHDAYARARTAVELTTGLFAVLVFELLFRDADLSAPARRRLVGALTVLGALGWTAAFAFANRAEVLHEVLARPLSKRLLWSVRTVTDFDRDGYSSFFGGGDDAPFDSGVHPFVRSRTDVPVPASGSEDHAGEALAKSVVVITIDSLRADHLSAYGAAHRTSPNLDAWARGATRFDHAFTSGGWTSVAIPSLLTGRYPRKLAWTSLQETNRLHLLPFGARLAPGEWRRKVFALPLHDPQPTLPEVLRRRGLHTTAVVDDGATGYFARSLGALRGFDDYVEVDRLTGTSKDDRATADAAIAAVRRHRGTPFFLWVHFFGPHAPSTVHEGTATFGEGVAAGYDHEIAFLDQHLGRLLAELDATPSTSVVVTADHGEELDARVRFHGLSTHPGAARIPLFVKGRGFAAGSATKLASLVDVFPTVLASAGASAGSDGCVLTEPCERAAVFFDTWRFSPGAEVVLDLAAAFSPRVVASVDLKTLDSWSTDPSERLISRDPAVERALRGYLAETGAVEVSP